MSDATLIFGDCLDAMRKLDASSVDAIVTDPPYGIRFMGQAWDGAAIEADAQRNARDTTSELRLTGSPDSPSRKLIPRTGSAYQTKAGEAGSYDFSLTGNRAFQSWVEAWATEALRVLKPGGHALVFGGTRTYHRLACGLEDAGFEIRDCLVWLYGTGFPKSLDVSKAIDKAAGAERAEVGEGQWSHVRGTSRGATQGASNGGEQGGYNMAAAPRLTAPATPGAERWQGWGTALKPAHEPIVVARKPLAGTVAANVLQYGTGAINVDACRIGFADEADERESKEKSRHADFGSGEVVGYHGWESRGDGGNYDPPGRWPANVVLDEEAAAMLDEQSGHLPGGRFINGGSGYDDDGRGTVYRGGFRGASTKGMPQMDSGGASRFFYCAKTSRAERNAGLEGFEEVAHRRYGEQGQGPLPQQTPRGEQIARNHHPTVKPLALMRWLVRLVTPPGGTVLDPFLGSGTTGIAAALEDFDFVGVEREANYLAIAQARIAFWREHGERALAIARGRTARAASEGGQMGLLE